MATKSEYTWYPIDPDRFEMDKTKRGEKSDVLEGLNAHAELGWELVTIVQLPGKWPTAILKRPRET